MSSIKKNLIVGVFWSAVEKYSSLILNIGISMILARILSPQEYGVVSIATVFISFLTLFASMGIGPAIIQRKDLSQQDLDNIFTFTLVVAAILSISLFLLSGSISNYFGEKELSIICKILSVNLFFSAANVVPNALMAKNQRFRDIAKRTVLLLLISGPLSIIIALWGGGVYSLLVSPIITSIGIYLYNNKYYPCHIRLNLSLSPVKSIFGYSVYQFLFEIINYFSRNLDKLIIGKHLSIGALGYYDKSYRLMLLPLNNITSVIGPVIQPVLSNIQNDKIEIAQKYLKIISVAATISFPLGVYLFFTADELIRFFYGSKWDLAIPAFKILSLSIPLQVVLCTSGSIYQVANATRSLFYIGTLNTCVTIIGMLISCFHFGTIEAVAYAWTVTTTINFCITYINLFAHVLKTNPLHLLKTLLNPSLLLAILSLIYIILPSINNWIVSLLIKSIIVVFASFLFVQISGQYNFLKVLKK